MESVCPNNIKVDVRIERGKPIALSAKVTGILDLKAGDSIDVVMDSRHGEYYLIVSGRNNPSLKGICRSSNTGNKGNNLRVHWKELVDAMLDNLKTEKGYYRVGEAEMINNQLHLPIITRKNYAEEDFI